VPGPEDVAAPDEVVGLGGALEVDGVSVVGGVLGGGV